MSDGHNVDTVAFLVVPVNDIVWEPLHEHTACSVMMFSVQQGYRSCTDNGGFYFTIEPSR